MDRITKAIELANKRRVDVQAGRSATAVLDFGGLENIPVSQHTLEDSKLVAGLLNNPVSEYYRVLRTKLLRLMTQNGWKVIGVTGPDSSSGKSLTATNLSIAIAMEPNHSALLIDADLRKPALAKQFGVEPKKGLSEMLSGKAKLTDVFYSIGIPRHAVLFNARQQFGSSDLLMGKAVKSFIDEVKSNEDGVVAIFDLPPVFVGDDAIAMSSLLDAVVIVVDAGRTTKQQLQATLELLKDANIAGCVLNNAPDSDCIAQQYSYY